MGTGPKEKFALQVCLQVGHSNPIQSPKGGVCDEPQHKKHGQGAALGVMAGTAVGAIGAYAAQKSPKEWKKTMKKAAHTAEKALDSVDKMLQSF